MTFRQFVAMLHQEYRNRHEGTAPPANKLLREPWVPAYLKMSSQKGVADEQKDSVSHRSTDGHAASV